MNIDFEEWWKTEPFGFDHPETRKGIESLLDSRNDKIKDLEYQLDKQQEIYNQMIDSAARDCEKINDLKLTNATLMDSMTLTSRNNKSLKDSNEWHCISRLEIEKRLRIAVTTFEKILEWVTKHHDDQLKHVVTETLEQIRGWKLNAQSVKPITVGRA